MPNTSTLSSSLPSSASLSTSTSSPTTTRSSSPSPLAASSTPSHQQSALSFLRRRVKPSPHSKSLQPTIPSSSNMFTSRKYTPLPTSSGGQRKRSGGGMASWKRYAIIGTLGLVVVGWGYSRLGSSSTSVDNWEENTYTPGSLDNGAIGDDLDYTSPPFAPVDEVEPEDEVDDEDMLHALPIDTNEETHSNEGHHGASESEEDFSEITDEEEQLASSGDNDDDEIPASEEDTEDTEDNEESTEIEPEADASDHATSFETDPDAASTTYCAEPYSPDKPLVQYALTIDAGSTGSRIHVYKFHNCDPSPQLEYETFFSVQPGLSKYARDPTAAAASLDPLLEEANRVVPESLRSCTPVEVKATAGLRLLGSLESDAILDEVRNRLETNYDFSVNGERAVEIMDGKDEGVYAWITANYLLNNIGEGATSDDTIAVMDLGGASTQIVFEPKFSSDQELAEGDHKYELSFGGRDFTLYQHSYLGYGLMRARRSVHNLVAFTWSFGSSEIDWDELSEDVEVPNPCLSRGTTRRVELDPPGRNAVNVTMHGAVGGYEACNRVVELVMAKDAICEVKPCSFNGVYQPSIIDTFPTGQLLALSYFTDRIKPLLPAKASSSLTIGELTSLAKDVCAGPKTWKKRWGKNKAALAELEDRPEYCLDLTFMNALLGLGYELSPKRELIVEKKLRGVELGWALGAGLALVEKAELTCTA